MRTRDLSPTGRLLPALALLLGVALLRDWLGVQGALETLVRALADALVWIGGVLGRALGWLLEQLAAQLLD